MRGDALADRGDDAGDLRPGRVRQRRRELVAPLDDQRVDEVHARRLDLDDDLARPGLEVGLVDDDEVVEGAEGVGHELAHAATLVMVPRSRSRASIAAPASAAAATASSAGARNPWAS